MKTCNINNALMSYLEQGSGQPLIMGHSFLWDAHMWDPQIAFFKNNYRCIAPELWSHGKSDSLPNDKYSLTNLAQDYWQFTQNLGLKKFALIGLSVGGMWATHLALEHPESVSALVLMGTYVGAEPPTSQKTYFQMMDQLEKAQFFSPALADMIAPYFFAQNTAITQPRLVDDFIKSLINTPKSHIAGKVALGRAIFNRESLLNRLKEIKIPTLVIVGAEDMPRPPKEAQEMADLIPDAELIIIPNAGHISTLERAEAVNNVLNDFLRKHVPFSIPFSN